jgi:hypothetical protein
MTACPHSIRGRRGIVVALAGTLLVPLGLKGGERAKSYKGGRGSGRQPRNMSGKRVLLIMQINLQDNLATTAESQP